MFWSLSLCVIAALAPVPAEAQSSNRFVVGCPARCDKSMCPRPPADCAAGQTLDVCNCCPVCASGEGEACGGSGKLGDPVCGEGLQCSVPGGVAYTITVRRRSRSGTCMCKSSEPVCGSDGVSYRNICELQRVSRRAQKLQQPPVLFIQRGACGKGRPSRTLSLLLLPACFCIFILEVLTQMLVVGHEPFVLEPVKPAARCFSVVLHFFLCLIFYSCSGSCWMQRSEPKVSD